MTMMLDIAKAFIGMLLLLFIPGYLLTLIVFRKLSLIERICLAIGLSISIAVSIGFNLSALHYITKAKGITPLNVWLALAVVTALFSAILVIQRYRLNVKKMLSRIIYGSYTHGQK